MKKYKNLLLLFVLCLLAISLNAQVFQQAIGLGGGSDATMKNTVTDSKGNVYLSGVILEKYNFGTVSNPKEYGPSSTYAVAFLAKYNSKMELQWLKGYESEGTTNISQINVDAQGNAYVAVGFKGNLNLNPADIAGHAGNDRGASLFAKYDENGNLLWHKIASNISDARGRGVAGDADGNIYIASSILGAYELETGVEVGAQDGKYNGFIAKYEAGGNLAWAKKVTPKEGSDLDVERLKVDEANNLYLAGFAQGGEFTAEGETKVVSSETGTDKDMFYAKFTPEGKLTFGGFVAGSLDDLLRDIVVDRDENIYLTLEVKSQGKVSVNKPSGGYQDITYSKAKPDVSLGLWIKLNKQGGYINHYVLGDGNNNAIAQSTAVEKSGYAFISGTASGTTQYTIDGVSYEDKGRGQSDHVMLRVDPSGNVVNYQRTGSSKNERGNGGNIAIDAVNNLFYWGVDSNFNPCDMGLKYGVYNQHEVAAGPAGHGKYKTLFAQYTLMSYDVEEVLTLEQYAKLDRKLTLKGAVSGSVVVNVIGTLPEGLTTTTDFNGNITLAGRPAAVGTYELVLKVENKEGNETYGYMVHQRLKLVVEPTDNIHILTPEQSVCFGAEVALEASIADGVWSGNGVEGSTFYSEKAGIGTHTITLTKGDKTAQITITVSASVGQDLTIKLDKGSEIIAGSIDPITATATTNDAEVTNPYYQFAINDPDFDKILQEGENNKFVFYDSDLLLGENTIYVKMFPSVGCTVVRSVKLTVKEYVDPSEPEVVEPEQKEEVRLEQNPITDGTLRILGLTSTTMYDVKIYTLSGTNVLNLNLSSDGSGDISSLKSGAYLVLLRHYATKQVVKKLKFYKQ